jgi:hypothetical protein
MQACREQLCISDKTTGRNNFKKYRGRGPLGQKHTPADWDNLRTPTQIGLKKTLKIMKIRRKYIEANIPAMKTKRIE